MAWVITGDIHGSYARMKTLVKNHNEDNIIVLGDVGFNYYGDNRDEGIKKCTKNTKFYCVRGNHEMRPQDVNGMFKDYDKDVGGDIYFDPRYPNIRYFKDYGEYFIDGHSVLVIGGAYSVDKHYRLQGKDENTTEWTGWFSNEQLSEEERKACLMVASGKHYDLVLSHTCPKSWEPVELFLSFIDQTKVDDSMEIWMDELKNEIDFSGWVFGHFHGDQYIRPNAQMFLLNVETIDSILECLTAFQKGENVYRPGICRSPYFYD